MHQMEALRGQSQFNNKYDYQYSERNEYFWKNTTRNVGN